MGIDQLEGAKGRIRFGKAHLRTAVTADAGIIHRIALQGIKILQNTRICGTVRMVHNDILARLLVVEHLRAFHDGVIGIGPVKSQLETGFIISC
ncbi:hypothetical protein D3C76_1585050 [compost metagenome]